MMNQEKSYQLPKIIPQQIFRAYDIRGIAPTELNANVVYAIGRAIATQLQQQKLSPVICAACDGRLSAPELFPALTAGLKDSGATVLDIGAVPTPCLYYATYQNEAHNGVMLTGSHNPKEYNGLKIVIAGDTLKEQQLLNLYQILINQKLKQFTGQIKQHNIIPQYIAAISAQIKLRRRLKIVIDCGNGITGIIAPELYRAIGCEVVALYENVDGEFPNHHPDPGQPKNCVDLINAVKEQQADIGLAFDGDGDRLGMVTQQGEMIWPDRLLMLFAQHILQKQKGTIIYDVKCSTLLKKIILDHGGTPLLWKTGHALIKAKSRETDALLAGEMSGHFFFSDRWFGFDDALYAGARLLEIYAANTVTVDQLFAAFPETFATPELNIAIPDQVKFMFIEQFCQQAQFETGEKIYIDGLRVEFNDGFGLVRASNTTPALVLRFEGTNKAALERIQNEFRRELLKLDAQLKLPF